MKRLISLILVFSVFGFCFSFNTSALSARSAAVICADTGEVLYSFNMNERRAVASTTKIMTGLLLCESGNLDKCVTVTRKTVAVEGTAMGLTVGERISRKNLLYGLLLCSGNDAANAIAESVGGSYENFVSLMNKKAEALGLKNTHFETPSGLDGKSHYSSAYDLAIITKEAMSNKDFRDVASTKSAVITYGVPPIKRKLTNHNKLLFLYDDIIGVKTGFTKKSGRCLVSMARKDGKEVIAVTLNDKDDWADHRKLLDMGLSKINVKKIDGIDENIPFETGENKVNAFLAGQNISSTDQNEITVKIFLPPFLYSPVFKGETVGKAEYYCKAKKVCEKPIKSNKTVKNKEQDKLKVFFSICLAIFKEYR
ncbi:MAG: D-alanyl-D-alanine carboxypeptidase [Clostridia bacterium]|nr:D-alanyl-D-alanine carboxypeptidase [Clostridia bacterium]